ncbi:hypothetical protein QQ008_04025 [Fulvivirgaceae bacterium BMA10]|uniref:Uncharacterized protein n=1 Tax=Splendidivirga corallicola TaxID=3051826 RepID=A0ABT8KL97_9BACT|nr:hypothetical protein [Fulvivirgaceae bacterium BMA10]
MKFNQFVTGTIIALSLFWIGSINKKILSTVADNTGVFSTGKAESGALLGSVKTNVTTDVTKVNQIKKIRVKVKTCQAQQVKECLKSKRIRSIKI